MVSRYDGAMQSKPKTQAPTEQRLSYLTFPLADRNRSAKASQHYGVKARYTLGFKREAVRLVHGGEKVSAIARTLGVSGQSLDNWVKAEAAGRLRDVRGKAVTAEQMEIARLKAELSRVRMERDILKKAAVYFARESR